MACRFVLTQRGCPAGWLAHDFLHHQVFRSRGWNNFVGLLLGNVGQVSLPALAGAATLPELHPGCLWQGMCSWTDCNQDAAALC